MAKLRKVSVNLPEKVVQQVLELQKEANKNVAAKGSDERFSFEQIFAIIVAQGIKTLKGSIDIK